MSSSLRTRVLPALAAVIAVLSTACADGAASPTGMSLAAAGGFANNVTETTVSSGTLNDPVLSTARVWVCKVGSSGTFDVSVNGGTPVQHTLLDDQCKEVFLQDFPPTNVETVVVTEVPSSLYLLDSIVVDSVAKTLVRKPTITGTNSVTAYLVGGKGAIATFYNHAAPPPPPPPTEVGQGCTPGYWKQRQHLGSWTAPYTKYTSFNSVFANAFPGRSLRDVLEKRGGGLNALGRHTVAALLNAASSEVDYDLTVEEVIAQFDAAYASGNYEDQKDVFADLNEQGCPLGRNEDGDDDDDDDNDNHGGHWGHHHNNVGDLHGCKRRNNRDRNHRGRGNHGGWGWRP